MAQVGSFSSRAHAEMAATMLQARGVPARANADDAGGAAPHVATGAGGFWVDVPDDSAEEARALLGEELDASSRSSPRSQVVRRVPRRSLLQVIAAVIVVAVLGVYLVEQVA